MESDLLWHAYNQINTQINIQQVLHIVYKDMLVTFVFVLSLATYPNRYLQMIHFRFSYQVCIGFPLSVPFWQKLIASNTASS